MKKKEKKKTVVKSGSFRVRTAAKAGSIDQMIQDAMKKATN